MYQQRVKRTILARFTLFFTQSLSRTRVYSEYDLDGTSNPQSIEKWEVNGDVITLIEDEYEQYDLKVLEISSNKLVLEFHDKDEASEHYAKMTYKRG